MNDIEIILSSGVHLTAPLAFAGAGEYIAERGGSLIVSLEAMMLAGAYFGILGSSIFGNSAAGLALGMFAGLVVGVIHSELSYRLSVNSFVVGIALNVFVLGVTSFLVEVVEVTPHQSALVTIPGLSSIPIIGEPFFSNRWPLFLLVLVFPLTWYLVSRTRWGLELRACGEGPAAADATGIPVNKRRRQSLYWTGLLAGLGGACLSVALVGLFNQNMTGGRGFIVNAAVIFGGWRLFGVLRGCLLFGLADALRLALPAMGFAIQPQLLIAAPYVIALLAMLFLSGRARRPLALGVPFARGVA